MKYFELSEAECPCCNQTIPESKAIWRFAEHIRELIGKPIIISSGFRCEEYNKRMHISSPKSKHLTGDALDIATGNLSPSDKYELLSEAIKWELRIGVYSRHIHVDYSPNQEKILWVGKY